MVRSLRAKLIVSYLAIIFICLVLAGGMGLYWLHRYIAWAKLVESIQRSWQEWLPLLGIGGLALAFSILVSYVFFRSVTQPLGAMTRAAEEMAQGRYKQEIPVNSQDEIGRLASAFNRMATEVERVQRSQRDFLVNISHDLQTPLTSIRGFSQAISEGTLRDADAVRRAEAVILEEADRMGRLIKEVSDLVRLEGGQIEMAKAPVRLDHLVSSAVERFAVQAKEGSVSLETDVPESLPTILGDAERLEQVLSNLVDNALKYTPAGGQVSVSAHVLDGARSSAHKEKVTEEALPLSAPQAGRWIVVTVADTGMGIRTEDLHRVFERMYRADKARASTDGAGLGLTIAREIVQAHGGYISATSQPNEGSQFHILLPANGYGLTARKG